MSKQGTITAMRDAADIMSLAAEHLLNEAEWLEQNPLGDNPEYRSSSIASHEVEIRRLAVRAIRFLSMEDE